MIHRLGIDVDGVLADFQTPYRQLFVATTGRDTFTDWPPQCWDFELAAGYTPQEVEDVWARINASHDFFVDLEAYPGAVSFLCNLRLVARDLADVYFITTRSGSAKRQTERWLKKHGFNEPTVLVNRDKTGEAKGALARSLDLTAVLDDKPENLADIQKAHPTCKVILRRGTWNVPAWNTYDGIDELQEFFKKALA